MVVIYKIREYNFLIPVINLFTKLYLFIHIGKKFFSGVLWHVQHEKGVSIMNIIISPKLAYNQTNTGIINRNNTTSFKADSDKDNKTTVKKDGKSNHENCLDRDMRNMANDPYYGYGSGCAIIPLGIALLGLGAACTNTVLEHNEPEPIVEEVQDSDSIDSFVQVFENDKMYDVECPPDAFFVRYPNVDLGGKLVPVDEYISAKKNSSAKEES